MTEDHRQLVLPSSFSPGQNPLPEPTAPLPGPTPEWTVQGVIDTLEPLTTLARRNRLREVLTRRLDAITVVLDNSNKPHNRAAVVRSCEAFGIQRAHFLNPAGQKGNLALSKLVSKGAHNWIDIIEHRTPQSVVEHFRNTGHRILVTHPRGKLRPSDLKHLPKVALIMGNEKFGVRDDLVDTADDTVAIAMTGFVESLNMSVTAAILLQAATEGRKGDLLPPEVDNIYARWLRNTVPRADEVLRSFPPR